MVAAAVCCTAPYLPGTVAILALVGSTVVLHAASHSLSNGAAGLADSGVVVGDVFLLADSAAVAVAVAGEGVAGRGGR